MRQSAAQNLFVDYQQLPGTFDELFSGNGQVRPSWEPIADQFKAIPPGKYQNYQRIADLTFQQSGITFTVYSDQQGIEKIFPFDLLPRIIAAQEWQQLAQGLKQRIRALNAFLYDVYHQREIIKEQIIPFELINSAPGYLPELQGITPPGKEYIHISGIDIVRDQNGQFLVLEDNLRNPSGVSYVLENRFVMKRLFPEMFARNEIQPVHQYPHQLRHYLSCLANKNGHDLAVLLTPGCYNSAYFEHCFLARKMGLELVRGDDLFVSDKKVFLKTTKGPKQVDIIYRRIDDDFLDPNFFNPKSLLGVPGLMQAYAAGNIILANAPGNGVADDKSIYPYVPEMIRFYLNEKPLLPQVHTYHMNLPEDRDFVFTHIEEMVIKAVDGSGGYDLLIGNTATKEQREAFLASVKKRPHRYITQPLVDLSTCPTFANKHLVARRVDLRPFIIGGNTPWVLPGGLTRVALTEGSYVVNSSQGGGSKDTWILENHHDLS